MKKRTSEEEEDKIAIEGLRSRADKSLAVFEKTLCRNGSGKYLVLRASDEDLDIVRRGGRKNT